VFARPGGARARARRRATGSCQDLGLQVWPFWPLELPLAFGRVCFPPCLVRRQARQATASVFGLWRVCFPPCLVRPGRRLPVQGLSEGSLGFRDRLPA